VCVCVRVCVCVCVCVCVRQREKRVGTGETIEGRGERSQASRNEMVTKYEGDTGSHAATRTMREAKE
jgi:hypothetical protein